MTLLVAIWEMVAFTFYITWKFEDCMIYSFLLTATEVVQLGVRIG